LFFTYQAQNSFDAINNAVAILIVVNIQNIGSKVFVYHFIDKYNFIFNHETYLRIEINPDEMNSSLPVFRLWFYAAFVQNSLFLVYW